VVGKNSISSPPAVPSSDEEGDDDEEEEGEMETLSSGTRASNVKLKLTRRLRGGGGGGGGNTHEAMVFERLGDAGRNARVKPCLS